MSSVGVVREEGAPLLQTSPSPVPCRDPTREVDEITPSSSLTEAADKRTTSRGQNERLVSLDVFRGLTVALMILVDDAGGAFPSINHSPWFSVTLADFVMPFFLFGVGVSVALVFKKISNKPTATKKVILRTIKLFILGLVLQGGYFHGRNHLTYGVDIDQIRWLGVLQRISIGYFLSALSEIWLVGDAVVDSVGAFIRKYFSQWMVAVLLCSLYMCLLYGLYVPNWEFELPSMNSTLPGLNDGSGLKMVHCGVRGSLDPPCNAVGFIDRLFLGEKHLYQNPVYRRTKECSVNSPDYGPLPPNSPFWCLAPFDPEGLGSKEAAAESIIYSYKHGFSGFAAKLTVSQAQQLAGLPGIVRVMPNRFHKRQTTRSWDFLGMLIHPPNNLLQGTNMGDGAIVGVIDSGVWPESKSFSDKGLGPIPSRWKGVCESGEKFVAKKHCNKKLIGARWFIKGLLAENAKYFNRSEFQDVFSSRDMDGHGTHTASTATGSPIDNVSYKGLGLGTVRGGAPRARLAIYKVLWNYDGQTTSADILKAFDEAINDGVDVLSLSIRFNPTYLSDVDELNPIAIGSFHAVIKGITVVSSTGNSGPSAQTVGKTAPWIIAVAASTIDRAFPTLITLGNNQTIMGSAMYRGKEIGFKRLISCDSFNQPDNTSMVGSVMLCFYEYDSFFKEAGIVGLITASSTFNTYSPSDFPNIKVDYNLGTQIFHYMHSTRFPVVKLSPSRTFVGKPFSSKIAEFSSRGPSMNSPEILKPDITAPGVAILAATSPHIQGVLEDKGFTFMSGTSMAAPHVSGVVALLKSLYPHWSPAAIRSAMVTTAWTTDPSGGPIFSEGSPANLANPFDFGGGIVNPNRAANPGLIYDMGIKDYIHYLCAMGYKNSDISRIIEHPITCPTTRPSILDVNVPSITIPSLTNTTTLTRTVTNVGAINSTYKVLIEPPLGITVVVQPGVLVFSPAIKMLSFTVTISTAYQVNTGYYFGSQTWSDGMHAVRIPISVRTQFT